MRILKRVRLARQSLTTAACVVRRVIGAPDYDRYLAHHQEHHSGTTPLTPREFERQRLADRYNRPGARCC